MGGYYDWILPIMRRWACAKAWVVLDLPTREQAGREIRMNQDKEEQEKQGQHTPGPEYVIVSNADNHAIACPMNWANASAWALSPLTKGKYPAGVTIVP